jgi:hypothetical protein
MQTLLSVKDQYMFPLQVIKLMVQSLNILQQGFQCGLEKLVHAPPVGIVVFPQAESAPITALKLAIGSTVTVCVVLTATNSYQTAFSVPSVQSPASSLSVAPTVDPVVGVQAILDVIDMAEEQMSFTANGGVGAELVNGVVVRYAGPPVQATSLSA